LRDNPDGRFECIERNLVDAWKQVGWYTSPVQYMYSIDGRTAVVEKKLCEEWKKNGWLESGNNITVYAPDGRTRTIDIKDVKAWLDVGWYTEPVSSLPYAGINLYTYADINLPTYTSVTGVKLKEERKSSDGDSIYVYTYTGSNDVSLYWSKLFSLGWKPFQEDSAYTPYIYESSFYKGDRFVIINVYLEFNEIWITY